MPVGIAHSHPLDALIEQRTTALLGFRKVLEHCCRSIRRPPPPRLVGPPRPDPRPTPNEP